MSHLVQRFSCLTLALFVCSGCASHTLSSSQPQPPAAAWTRTAQKAMQLHDASPDSPLAGKVRPISPPVTPDASPWWLPLQDATLTSCIETGLARNQDIAIAAARVRQARLLARAPEAARRPYVGYTVQGERRRTPESTYRDEHGVTYNAPPFHENQVQAGIEARYEIDLLGRLAAASEEANAERLATEAEAEAVRKWLVHEIIMAYADVSLAVARLHLAGQSHSHLLHLRTIEVGRLAAGLGDREAVRMADDKLHQASLEQTSLERARHEAHVRLSLLLGAAPAENPVLDTSWLDTVPVRSLTLPPDLPVQVIAARPDVEAAWQHAVASSWNKEQARLERYPRLALTGGTGFASETLRHWITRDALGWVLGLALDGPLLDGGRSAAKHERADAMLSEYEARYRKTVLQALGDVETASARLLAAQADFADAAATSERRKQEEAAIHARIRAGTHDLRRLLATQSARLESEQALLVSRHALVSAWAEGHKALGR